MDRSDNVIGSIVAPIPADRTDSILTYAARFADRTPLFAITGTPTPGDDTITGDGDPDTIDGGAGDDIIEGGAGDDHLIGGEGGDWLMGESGNDLLDGGDDADWLTGGDGSDTMTGGGGSDTISGSLTQMDGDVITDFTGRDIMEVDGYFDAGDLTLFADRAVFSVDADKDGTDEITITLLGDFRDGVFTYRPKYLSEFSERFDTHLRYYPFLPTMKEKTAIDPADVNGMYTYDFISQKGDYSDHKFFMRSDIMKSQYENVVGMYQIADDGSIVNIRIMNSNTFTNKNQVVDFFSPRGAGLDMPFAFFVIAHGGAWLKELAETTGGDLSFIDKTDGSVATVHDGPNVTLAVDGVATDQIVFHSYDKTLNPDGLEHVVTGVLPSDGDRQIVFSFEDQLGGGDRDFQDVVFTILEEENWISI